MSGLVFVQDADGRPLMPTSNAYARTLLHAGKANRRAHPAFTVIQLTQVIPEPVLRPVLLSITLYRWTAQLIILADQAKGAHSSIFIVVDLLKNSSRYGRQSRRGWTILSHLNSGGGARSGRSFQHHGPASYIKNVSFWRIEALVTVISAIQQLIPITHIVMVPSTSTLKMLPGSRGWIARKLVSRLAQLGKPIKFLEMGLESHVGLEPLSSLSRTVVGLATHSGDQVPRIVARYIGTQRLRNRVVRSARRRGELNMSLHTTSQQSSVSTTPPNRLYTVRLKGDTLTGLLVKQQSLESYILKVPAYASHQMVTWQRIRVHADDLIRVWPITPVIILPLRSIQRP